MTYASLREKIRAEKVERLSRYSEFLSLYDEASRLGYEAGRAATPRPMHVYDGFSREHIETVSDGLCGFAWVKIRPATSSFARYMLKHKLARTSYMGGIEIGISAHNQSYERKIAHARAMAEHFRANGINAYADGRLD